MSVTKQACCHPEAPPKRMGLCQSHSRRLARQKRVLGKFNELLQQTHAQIESLEKRLKARCDEIRILHREDREMAAIGLLHEVHNYEKILIILYEKRTIILQQMTAVDTAQLVQHETETWEEMNSLLQKADLHTLDPTVESFTRARDNVLDAMDDVMDVTSGIAQIADEAQASMSASVDSTLRSLYAQICTGSYRVGSARVGLSRHSNGSDDEDVERVVRLAVDAAEEEVESKDDGVGLLAAPTHTPRVNHEDSSSTVDLDAFQQRLSKVSLMG